MSNAQTSASLRADDLTSAQLRTLATVWITYGTFYFCRVNIGAAVPGIKESLQINPFEMGLVLGALKIGYAFGQFINGQLAERFGPKRILLLGMFGSVAACLAFPFAGQIAELPGVSGLATTTSTALTWLIQVFGSHETLGTVAALLLGCWLFNGYFQAGGWPPCVKVMANWFSPTERGRMMGVIGTSYQIGSAITIVTCGWLIDAFGKEWRVAFVIPAGLFLLSAVHTTWRLRESPKPGESAHLHRVVATETIRLSARQTLWVTFTNGRIWMLALGLFGLDVVRFGFLDWVPTHLKEVQGTAISSATLKAAVLPLGGALGALVSGWMSDRYFQSRRAPVIAGCLLLVGITTIVYQRAASAGWVATVTCLGTIGFFIYGAKILLVGTAAQDLARRRTTAAAAGFVDFMGYMGAFAGDVVTGWLLKHRDWHAAIYFWAGTAIVSALLVATLWNARADSDWDDKPVESDQTISQ